MYTLWDGDSNLDFARSVTIFGLYFMNGLGLWPLATILCMSEVKLGSRGLYKAPKAAGSHLPETASGFRFLGGARNHGEGTRWLKMSADRQ